MADKQITIDPVTIEGNPMPATGFRAVTIPLEQYRQEIGNFFKSKQGHEAAGSMARGAAKAALPVAAPIVDPLIDHPQAVNRMQQGVSGISGAATGGIAPLVGSVANAATRAAVAPTAPPTAAPAPNEILRGQQGQAPGAPPSAAPAAPAEEPLSLSGSLPGSGPVQHIAAHNLDTVDPGLRQELMGAADREKEAVVQQGDAAAQQDLTKAAGMMNVGTQLEQDAQKQKQRADFDAEQLAARRDRIDALASNVAKMAKLDPDQYWTEKGDAKKLGIDLALMLGTFGSSFLGQRNTVLESINRDADKNIEAQKDAYNRANGQLDDQRNLYALAMQATGDPVEAQKVARNMLLDSVKMKADAQAMAAGSQTHIANAARLGTQIDRMKAEDDIKTHQYVQAKDIGGGPTGPKPEELLKMAADFKKDAAGNGKEMTDQAALDHARALWYGSRGMQVHGAGAPMAKESPTSGPGGMTREQAGALAKERLEAQTGTDEFNKQMDNLARSPVLNQIGWDTALLSNAGQRVAPASTKTVQALKEINTQTLQAVGKVAKDADGKPNKEMIAKIEERFEIHPGDTKEVALQKIEGVRQVYNALARQQGAAAPEPNKSAAPSYFTPSK